MLRTLLVSAVLAAAILATEGVSLANASSYPPPLSAVSPDFVTVVPAGGLRHVPARFIGSDVQCYSARTGASLVQRSNDHAGPYWTTRGGRAVAGFDRVNHDFVSFGPAVVCASWAE